MYEHNYCVRYVNSTALDTWRDYLAKHSAYILGGTHFINFAVQEPGGAMILEASYGQNVKSGK